ncbi:hypothetical protein ACQ86N_44905 [Puia sp. P3]|uniref:hypothetical protein n=1 Tax=Puia sp. P3 TaxID=3423952 RepID=UPI003D677F32
MMTLAPEQCDPGCIQLLQQQGVVVSAGHSNATYEQAIDGFYLGIPAATHLFNAMSPCRAARLEWSAPSMTTTTSGQASFVMAYTLTSPPSASAKRSWATVSSLLRML